MNILENIPITNKTWKYLYLSLKGWGPELVATINTSTKVQVVVKDCLSEVQFEPAIYIVFEPDLYHKVFYNTSLTFLREHEAYIADYPIYKEEGKKNHVVALKIPPKFEKAYKEFLKGRYSQMYTRDEILELYSSPVFDEYRDVLLKTDKAKKRFIVQLNKEFNTEFDTDFKQDERTGVEYDLPLKTKEEYLNNNCPTVYVVNEGD